MEFLECAHSVFLTVYNVFLVFQKMHKFLTHLPDPIIISVFVVLYIEKK